ncbi:MAG: hypothetical protein K2W99_01195 [Chthoniobacterales bacterium]|nr:hypothetical protein [Chthoniobacterales bacterium]
MKFCLLFLVLGILLIPSSPLPAMEARNENEEDGASRKVDPLKDSREEEEEELIQKRNNGYDPSVTPTVLLSHNGQYENEESILNLDNLDQDIEQANNDLTVLREKPSETWCMERFSYWAELHGKYDKTARNYILTNELTQKLEDFYEKCKKLEKELTKRLEESSNQVKRTNPYNSSDGSDGSMGNLKMFSEPPTSENVLLQLSNRGDHEEDNLHVSSPTRRYSLDPEQLQAEIKDAIAISNKIEQFSSKEWLGNISAYWTNRYDHYEKAGFKKPKGAVFKGEFSKLVGELFLVCEILQTKIQQRLAALSENQLIYQNFPKAELRKVEKIEADTEAQLYEESNTYLQKLQEEHQIIKRILVQMKNDLFSPKELKIRSVLNEEAYHHYLNIFENPLLKQVASDFLTSFLEDYKKLHNKIEEQTELHQQQQQQQQKEEETKQLETLFLERLKSLEAQIQLKKKQLHSSSSSSSINKWRQNLLKDMEDSLKEVAKKIESIELLPNSSASTAINLLLNSVEKSLPGLELLDQEDTRKHSYQLIRKVLFEKAQYTQGAVELAPLLIQRFDEVLTCCEEAINTYDKALPELTLLFHHKGVARFIGVMEDLRYEQNKDVKELLPDLQDIADQGIKNWKANNYDTKTNEQLNLELSRYNTAFLSRKRAIDTILCDPTTKPQTTAEQIEIAHLIKEVALIPTIKDAKTNFHKAGIAYFEAWKENGNQPSQPYYKKAGECFSKAAKATNEQQKENFQLAGHYFFQAGEEAKKNSPNEEHKQANLSMASFFLDKASNSGNCTIM